MIMRLFLVLIALFLFNTSYANNNPFEKKERVAIGIENPWHIQHGTAVKTTEDNKGNYIHLAFDNKQLRLTFTEDKAGKLAEEYKHLGINNVQVDGKTLPLFNWCLANQTRQNRFLQQGLVVKDNRCMVNGERGEFILQLDAATRKQLNHGKRLVFVVKPYRTHIEISYDLADFNNMAIALSVKLPTQPPLHQAAIQMPVINKSAPVAEKKCWVDPPAKYHHIKPVEYNCSDGIAKKIAESQVIQRVTAQKVHEKQLLQARQKKIIATQAERKRMQEAKHKQLETLREQRKQQKEEVAAIAASQVKQSEISSEITVKMVSMCQKLWSKGMHRCYCQKYIAYAPAAIKAGSKCK